MDADNQRTPRSELRARAVVIRRVGWTTTIVLVVLVGLAAASTFVVGDPLYKPNVESSVEPDAALRSAFQVVLESQLALVELVTLVFGVAAFLLTYQVKRGVHPTAREWAQMGGGLVLLIGALASALLSVDLLLRMAGRNSIDLGVMGLRMSRWATFAFMTGGVSLIGAFALTVTLRPTPPGATSTSEVE